MKQRVLLAAFCAAAACRALPSAVPLADSGGVAAGVSANDRDRRPAGARDADGEESSDDDVVVTVDSKPDAALATSDAGTPDASGAPATDAGDKPAEWPGEYYGSDRFVRHFDSKPDDVQVDDKAHTRVAQPSASSLVISLVNSLSGDVICALKADVKGAEATLETGQSCFAGEGVEAEVTSGRAKLAGDLLTLDFEGNVASEDDEEGEGKDTYHFEGRRR